MFIAAVGAAAWLVFQSNPESASALLLLAGLAGVVFLALFAFGAADNRRPVVADREILVDALEEPAAVAAPDGRLLAANAAWKQASGDARRLPRGGDAPALYAALAEARSGAVGRALVRLGDQDFEAVVSRFEHGNFLVRAATEGVLSQPLMIADNRTDRAVAQLATDGSGGRDAFAAAAPFGAAALSSPDLFEAEIVEINPAMAALTSGGAAPGVKFADLFEPASLIEARARTETSPGSPIEAVLKGDKPRQARLITATDDGRPLVYVFDISDQKQLELHLGQAQKMQAIGQLAGGVAHDFNNLLTAIQLQLDELLVRHPAGDPSYQGLTQIKSTSNRAADLVRQLLAFSRKQTVKRETLELGELISAFEVLLRRLMREDVALETDYGRDLPTIHADRSQLETAVMNLAVNARDAMRGQEGARVLIKTSRLTRAQARDLGWAHAPDGDAALIEVSDNGPGVPPELLSKIFEPFFTTKAVGEGTGMGLAMVYGMVEQSGGHIHVDSKAGQGATFRIFLPEYIAPPISETEPSVAAQPAQPAAPPKPRDLSGAGKILFVEDEREVRTVAARLLRARGYEVIEAADGEEALILAEEHAGSLDMLISDVIMPGMDGPTLLKKARGYLGDAPVMFISGYAEAEFSDLLEGETGVSFLPKPVDIKTLAERVKQELRAA
jgi:two-component system cell cycle sensor histidine kinase/response regulator CckA